MSDEPLSPRAEELRMWDLMEDIRIAMLTTIEDGQLISRPMSAYPDSVDRKLYFITSIENDLSRHLAADSRLNVAFADTKNQKFISLSGRGALVDDRARIDSLWNMFAQAWFPGGPSDPDVTLLVVEPHSAQIWHGESNKAVQLWETAKAAITRTKPDMGDTVKVGFESDPDPMGGNQGEGNREAARQYNTAATDFARTGPVEQAARDAARALDGSEGVELKRAEQVAAGRAREEDPLLRGT